MTGLAKLVAQRNKAVFQEAIDRSNVQLSILGGPEFHQLPLEIPLDIVWFYDEES